MTWQYNGGDAGISLFTACLKAGAPIDFKPGMRVLEVGCCESDWLKRASETWPDVEFVGIDCNAKDASEKNWATWKADVLQADLFEPNSFDAVVSLSAIEHVGLGHYGDPKDEHGDSKAIANIWRWLKPGGFLYFDVPYNPEGYSVLGTECRIYDDLALTTRMRWLHATPIGDAIVRVDGFGKQELFVGYSDSKAPGTLVSKPTVAAKRYWYVAMCWRKA